MRRAALLALAVLATGCGAAKDEGISGGGKVIGRTVTVYSLTNDPGTRNRDFVDGEKLALSDAGGKAGDLAVNFTSLDLGGEDRDAQAEAIRRAISDPQIIAAVVDATPVTVPLFNAAGILQVAPGGDATLAEDPQALPSGKPTVGAVEGDLPAEFDNTFEAAYDRKATPEAQRGYVAMAGIIQAIADAGAAGNDRARVLDAYL